MSDLQELARTVYRPPRARSPWRLVDLFADSELRFFSLARHALEEAFRHLGVKAGDAVLMPEFVCREVLAPAAAVGARVEFYAVDPSLAPATSSDAWPTARAVLAVDFFGFPQDLSPFRAYRRRTGAAIIEDNAHGLFSRDSDGVLLGRRGDLGVLSIRKTIPLPNGGALVAPKGAPGLAPQRPFGGGASARFTLKAAYRKAAWALGARGGSVGLDILRSTRQALTGGESPPPSDDRESAYPSSFGSPCAELDAPLTILDPERERERRRALYFAMAEILEPLGARPVLPPPGDLVVPYGYAFRAELQATRAIEDTLRGLGLRSLGWPDLPSVVERRAPAHYRNVRVVHFLW